MMPFRYMPSFSLFSLIPTKTLMVCVPGSTFPDNRFISPDHVLVISLEVSSTLFPIPTKPKSFWLIPASNS